MARDSTLAREKQIVIPSAGLAMDSGGGGSGNIISSNNNNNGLGGGCGGGSSNNIDKAGSSSHIAASIPNIAAVASQVAPQITDEISQQILELKKKQEMKMQNLWYAFQEQKHQLELQHQQELEQTIKVKAFLLLHVEQQN